MIKYSDSTISVASKYEIIKYLKTKKIIFVDTETTIEKNPKCLTIQIGDKDKAFLIDTRTEDPSFLKPFLEDENIRKVAHNLKFDYKVLKNNFNIVMENVYCTMLGEMVQSTGLVRPSKYFSLEKTFIRYYGHNPYGTQLKLFEPYTPKQVRESISTNLYEDFTKEQIYYMFLDIVSCNGVYNRQQESLLKEDLINIADFESEYTLALGDKELNGVYIDKEEWTELADYSLNKTTEYLEKLNETELINWNSQQQAKPIFKRLNINLRDKDKESIAEKILSKYRSKFTLVDTYLRYKKYKKLNGTYGLSFLDHVQDDGRIHPSYFQIVDTGRISCSNPNMQNIPSKKKELPEGNRWRTPFKAEEGNTLVVADFSQQELRILAKLANEPRMLKAFENKEDLHIVTASAIYNKEIGPDDPERGVGKTVNFAVAYGSSAILIAERLGISIKEAEKIINTFYNKFKSLRKFFDSTFEEALRTGYILIDDIVKRKVYIEGFDILPFVNERERKRLLGEIYRHCQNYKIQGNGANITKMAEILLRKEVKKNPIFKVILTVHDEIVLECRIEDSNTVSEILRSCMEKAALYFGVVIPADTVTTPVWAKH